MSLFQDLRFAGETRVVLWKIDRPEEDLRSSVLAESHPEVIAHVLSEARTRFGNERRRNEWLAVRACMAHILNRVDIAYRSNGEPYLPESGLAISISHTDGVVAVALSSLSRTGVDVQAMTPRITALESKLCSEEERSFLSSAAEERRLQLLLIFSMKESLYKALDELDLLYLTAFRVKPFTLQQEGEASMAFSRNNYEYPFRLQYKDYGSFVLTCVSF
jgi:4'-phosphopantetheinyl transferase